MKQYQVARGVAKFGPGQTFTLSAAQIAPRKHNLDLPSDWDGKSPAVVTARVPLHFKAGEEIGLPELARSMVGFMTPVETAEVEKPAVVEPTPPVEKPKRFGKK